MPSRHALLRHAAQIDRAEHGAVLGVDHRRVLRRVAEDVDPLVEGIEVDAVRLRGAHINGLDQLHRLGVEHRYSDGLLVKPWPDFGIDRGAIPSDARDLTDRLERVEIEDRQPCRDRWRRGRRVRGRNRARPPRGIYSRRPAASA